MNRLNASECRDHRPYLVEHAVGVSGRMRERIEHHLARCEPCRQRVEFIRGIKAAIPEQQPGARLGFQRRLEAVAGEAERRADPVRWQRRFVISVLGTAATVVALFGGLMPSVQEAVLWVAKVGPKNSLLLLAASAALLLLSSPLLLTRSRSLIGGNS